MLKYLYIKNSELFKNLDEERIKKIAEISVIKKFLKNEIIAKDQEPVTGLYIVGSGNVKVSKISETGQVFILKMAVPGEAIAEVVFMLDNPVYPAEIECTEDSELIYISKTDFIELLKQDSLLGIYLLKIFSKIVLTFKAKAENIALTNITERLMNYFIKHSKKVKSKSFELDISKQDLAALLGTVPETISRALKKLEKQKQIKINGKFIELIFNSVSLNPSSEPEPPQIIFTASGTEFLRKIRS
jgi:CRP/FNR family transcriptional regulator